MTRYLHSLPLLLSLLILGSNASAEPGGAWTLERAMADAAGSTVDARLAAQQVAEAEAATKRALGNWLPTLSATGTVTRNDREVRLGDSVVVNLWDYSGQARADVTLFDGASIPDWVASRDEVEASKASARWDRAGLRAAAARAYLAALAARRNVEAAESTVELRQASRDDAALRVETGFAAASDEALAEVSLAEAEALAVDARRTLADTLDALLFVTGRQSVLAEQLTDPGLDTRAPSPLDEVLLRRPDREAQLHLLDAQSHRLLGDRLELLPEFRLGGNYFFGRPNFRSDTGAYWTVTLTATWTLFDYARYGDIDATAATMQRLEWEMERWERQLEVDHRLASRRVRAADEQHRIAERGLGFAERNQSIVATRYRAGEATALERITAEQVLFQSRIRLSLAQLERDLAVVELQYLEGGLDQPAEAR